MIKLGYLVSHPIQYQAPLLRMLSSRPEIELDVYFQSNFSTLPFFDPGFGRLVEWDVPLLEGYKSHNLGPHLLNSIGRFNFSSRLFKHLSAEKKTILWIHGFANPYYAYVIERALRSGIQVFIRDDIHEKGNVRSPWKEKLKRYFFKSWSRRGAGFLAVGTLNQKYYIDMGVPSANVFVLPYAVDGKFFEQRSAEARADIRAERALIGVDPDARVVLFASKLMERKRGADLLEAFRLSYSRLQQEGIKSVLVFAGSGEEEAALKEAATDLPVVFLGFQNQQQLARLFGVVDIFVLPSRREPWGLVVNEAMSASLPVIVSDEVGCWPDLVINDVNGYVFKAGDTAALADRLEDALRHPDRLAEMGRESRKIISGWGFDQDVEGFLRAAAWSDQGRARP